jgi:CheY-like chemotaxis protein
MNVPADNISHLLDNTHLLVMYDESTTRDLLIQLFRSMGATVHHAENQTKAIGMYFRLFQQGIRPRAVVTSWWMSRPDSSEREFLKLIGREEIDATALDLFRNIYELDPTAFLATYTRDVVSADVTLRKYKIPAEIFSRVEMEPEAFVARIATHEGISRQRADESETAHGLRMIRVLSESGLYKALRTPLPDTVPAYRLSG